jgi:hypothetical protein
MIRFIDLTETACTDPECGVPSCAFLHGGLFIENRHEEHTFDSQEEVNEHPESHRLRGLMPDNFFGEKVAC